MAGSMARACLRAHAWWPTTPTAIWHRKDRGDASLPTLSPARSSRALSIWTRRFVHRRRFPLGSQRGVAIPRPAPVTAGRQSAMPPVVLIRYRRKACSTRSTAPCSWRRRSPPVWPETGARSAITPDGSAVSGPRIAATTAPIIGWSDAGPTAPSGTAAIGRQMISDDAVSEIAAFGAPRHPIPTVRKSACALLRRLARTSGKVGYGQFEPFDRLAGGRRIAAAGLPRRQPFWGVRSWVGALEPRSRTECWPAAMPDRSDLHAGKHSEPVTVAADKLIPAP